MWPFAKSRFVPHVWDHTLSRHLAIPTPSEEVFAFFRAWLQALEDEEFVLALEMTHPAPRLPTSNIGPAWLEAMVSNYGRLEPRRDGRAHRVTAAESASYPHPGRRSKLEADECELEEMRQTGDRRFLHPSFPCLVIWFGEPPAHSPLYAGWAEIFLPLDGEWSALVASFSIMREGEFHVLQLDDLGIP